MISVEEARSRVLAACPRLHPVAIALADALGCVTSVSLVADEPVPPFTNTAMDGFAVRAADTVGAPVGLKIVGTLPAGADPATVSVGAGEAVRIMTGAAIPEGADAVVMVEHTHCPTEDEVVIEAEVPPGNHLRPAGEDLARGQEVFPPGTVLEPGHLGVLASIGMQRVPVFPRARVGVVSTGDELVDGPGELRPGQIRDSNRRTLLALVASSGCEPVDLGLARDDEAAITEVIERGTRDCHAVITTGGVSMGDYDYVKAVLDRLSSGGMSWMQIAVKPAKPLSFGVVGETPVFGLPGNPVSSMVSFELFARPALRQMMGHTVLDRPRVPAIADEPLERKPDGKLHLVRVVASPEDDGRFHVRSAGGQGSNLLRTMALSNALAMLPDGDGVEAGGEVQTMLLAYA